jgi:hypothetical protein
MAPRVVNYARWRSKDDFEAMDWLGLRSDGEES